MVLFNVHVVAGKKYVARGWDIMHKPFRRRPAPNPKDLSIPHSSLFSHNFERKRRLDLETPGLSATTTLLELGALGDRVWLFVLVRASKNISDENNAENKNTHPC